MATPRKINKKATVTFLKLIEGLTEDHRSKRLGGEIGDSNNTYMPVSVEFLYTTEFGGIFSVSHYGIQNGDLMSDPDVTFLQMHSGHVYPMTYRNDYMGVNQEEMFITEDGIKFSPSRQKELAVFCGSWMENIKHQQNL